MFYGYFRPFNLICNIFGLVKPIITSEGKSIKIHFWLKLWSIVVAVGIVSSYSFSLNRIFELDLKHEIEIIPDINDLIGNVVIIVINLINCEKICMNIHELLDDIFKDFNIDAKILKLFAKKMYLWFFTPVIIFAILIVTEMMNKYPPYCLLIRMPTFLSIMHLIMHLFTILALLKVINHQLSRTLFCTNKAPKMIFIENIGVKGTLKYVFNPSIGFIEVDDIIQFDLKFLCKIYDNLSTCIHLLEKCYGLQILLSIWLMFTSGMIGVTVIVINQNAQKWLVIVKSVLPYFWCFIGCYINDQISKEVDQTITLIIKCLIDYRCIQTRKPVLETFKELVSNDRLQFTACSLFNLSYSMLLGTMLNVITYSIILIQLF